jgi:hypothetical protein
VPHIISTERSAGRLRAGLFEYRTAEQGTAE